MLRRRGGAAIGNPGNKFGVSAQELGGLLRALLAADGRRAQTLAIDADELYPKDRPFVRGCVLAAHGAGLAVIVAAARISDVEEPVRLLCGSLIEAAPQMVVVEHYEDGISGWVLD